MSIEGKALRLVRTGKVRVTYSSVDVLVGVVQGDHGTYTVQIDPDGEHCDCPARVRCSHIAALDAAEAMATAEAMADAPGDTRGVRTFTPTLHGGYPETKDNT